MRSERGDLTVSIENPWSRRRRRSSPWPDRDADAVITGTLREYGEVRSGPASANVISLSVQMMEAETGKVVWSASSTKGGISAADRLFGGGGKPMNAVTQEAVDDLIDKLFR